MYNVVSQTNWKQFLGNFFKKLYKNPKKCQVITVKSLASFCLHFFPNLNTTSNPYLTELFRLEFLIYKQDIIKKNKTPK